MASFGPYAHLAAPIRRIDVTLHFSSVLFIVPRRMPLGLAVDMASIPITIAAAAAAAAEPVVLGSGPRRVIILACILSRGRELGTAFGNKLGIRLNCSLQI